MSDPRESSHVTSGAIRVRILKYDLFSDGSVSLPPSTQTRTKRMIANCVQSGVSRVHQLQTKRRCDGGLYDEGAQATLC